MSNPVYIRGVELRVEYVAPGLYRAYVDDLLQDQADTEAHAWRVAVKSAGLTPFEASMESEILSRKLSGFALEGAMDDLFGRGCLLGDRARRTGT